MESGLVVDSGLSILGLQVGSVHVQGALEQVASLKFIVSSFRCRYRFGSEFKRAVGFCLSILELTFGRGHGLNKPLRG